MLMALIMEYVVVLLLAVQMVGLDLARYWSARQKATAGH